MIITIDTTKDTFDVKDIYSDSEVEKLKAIRDAVLNRETKTYTDNPYLLNNTTLRNVIRYLQDQPRDNTWEGLDLRGNNKIAQIKLVRAVTGWGLKESKDFVEGA